MQIDPDTVDLTIPGRMPDLDDQEVRVYRNFVYFVYLLKTLRHMSEIYQKVKKGKNWQSDPELLALAPRLQRWEDELPPDMKYPGAVDMGIQCPPPTSHFSGNVQCYYHLARILLHRPVLTSPKGLPLDNSRSMWKTHMEICSVSAKAITRIIETIIQSFGIRGLQCMIRGVNFTIYCLLSSTLINLVTPSPCFRE